jgi:hypothetical protein
VLRSCDGRSKSKVPSYFDDVIALLQVYYHWYLLQGQVKLVISIGTAAAGDAYWYNLQCICNSGLYYIFGRIAEIQVGKRKKKIH